RRAGRNRISSLSSSGGMVDHGTHDIAAAHCGDVMFDFIERPHSGDLCREVERAIAREGDDIGEIAVGILCAVEAAYDATTSKQRADVERRTRGVRSPHDQGR